VTGTKEQIRQSIIAKRKRKGSDSDSYDEEEGGEAGFQIVSSQDDSNAEKELIAAANKTSGVASTQVVTPVQRGRGRPRGSVLAQKPAGRGTGTPASAAADQHQHVVVMHDKDPQQQPVVATEPVFLLNPTEPHSYQKGDFVIERKDAWKASGFPIWRIETGKLLQKFDPIPIEGGIIHKSASVYSSWSGDIRTSFKAILVDMITSTAGRKQETVKVQEKFVAKAAEDSLDEDPLMGTFAVFMHTMMSAALDSTFLASIVQNEEDEYYMSSVRQIDTLLSAATQSILSQIAWTETFKLSADALPYYVMTSLPQTSEQPYQCQACEDGVTPAVRSVKFYGVVYDRDLLTPTAEVEKASAQEFLIGKPASEILISYHALQHFKFILHQKCQEEVVYLRQTKKATDVDILTECLQNRIFLQHYFRELQSLLQQFIIVEHAVEPALDPSALEAAQGLVVEASGMEGGMTMVAITDPSCMEGSADGIVEQQQQVEMEASAVAAAEAETALTAGMVDLEGALEMEQPQQPEEEPSAMEMSADDQSAAATFDPAAVAQIDEAVGDGGLTEAAVTADVA
jgi:hypothetical protein